MPSPPPARAPRLSPRGPAGGNRRDGGNRGGPRGLRAHDLDRCRCIAALRSTHDELAAVVRDLSDEQLLAPSGAAEWPVAQVLSHLGSGAEIAAATLRSARGGGRVPDGFNQAVWDRWNAMSPREQADGFVRRHGARRGDRGAHGRAARVPAAWTSGSCPRRCPLATYVGMRLGEAAAHSWDVRVAFDEDAAIEEATARAARRPARGRPRLHARLHHRADRSRAGSRRPGGSTTTCPSPIGGPRPPARDDGDFEGSADAVARLMAGRLTPGRTPAGRRRVGEPRSRGPPRVSRVLSTDSGTMAS